MTSTVNTTDVVLQSGVRASALALAPGISVRRTAGAVGVEVDGIDLAEPLEADQIRSLVTIWSHAGVMILRGQDRPRTGAAGRGGGVVRAQVHRGAGPDAIDQLPMVGQLPVQLLSNRDRRRRAGRSSPTTAWPPPRRSSRCTATCRTMPPRRT